MLTQVRLVVSVISLLGLIGLFIYADHRGYVRGAAERNAYYEQQLAAALLDKQAADTRSADIEKHALAAAINTENTHAAEVETLNNRAAVASERISVLLRQLHARNSCGGSQQLPAPAGPAGATAGAGSGDELDDRFSERLAGVGRACEHDADELTRFAAFYEQLRATFNQGSPP